MNFNELRKYARETLGLVFSRTPKKEELEVAVAQAETERAAVNNPDMLRAQAETLRAQADEISERARKAEERAQSIEGAQVEAKVATSTLRLAMVRYREAMASLAALGLPVSWDLPENVVKDFITRLTPSVQIFVFWVEGHHEAARGYVLAESFNEARTRWEARDVDYGTAHPGCCGWPAAIARDLPQLQEGGEVYDEQYLSTLHAATLSGCLFEFILDGPEYEGRAVVNALTFDEARAKALAGDIIEGDRVDPEIATELKTALDALRENGRVEHLNHVLTCHTLV